MAEVTVYKGSPSRPNQSDAVGSGVQRALPFSSSTGSSASEEFQIAADVEVQPLQQDVSHQALFGTICNILSTILLMAMGSFAKLSEEHGLPVMEIVLARSIALFVIPAATALVQGQNLRGNNIGLLAVRGICGTLGISLWYLALLLLPLTDVVVFGFLTPLFVALGSPLVVKEHPSRMVFTMTPVCIVGVVLSVQPTFIFGGKQRLNTAGVIVAVFQACVAACTKLSIRELRKSDSSSVIIFSAGLFATVISCAACAFIPGQFVLPRSRQQIMLLIGTGITAYLFQLTMTLGLRRVKAAPAAAMAYLTVVWGTAAGVVVFGEIPTVLSVMGALIICIGTLAVIITDSWPSHGRKSHPYSLLQQRGSLERKDYSLGLSKPGMEAESTAPFTGRRSLELARKSTDGSCGRERLHSIAH